MLETKKREKIHASLLDLVFLERDWKERVWDGECDIDCSLTMG